MPTLNHICPSCARAAGVSEHHLQELLEFLEWRKCSSCGRQAGTYAVGHIEALCVIEPMDVTKLDAPPRHPRLPGFAERFIAALGHR